MTIIHLHKHHNIIFCQGKRHFTQKNLVLLVFACFINSHLNGFNQKKWISLHKCLFCCFCNWNNHSLDVALAFYYCSFLLHLTLITLSTMLWTPQEVVCVCHGKKNMPCLFKSITSAYLPCVPMATSHWDWIYGVLVNQCIMYGPCFSS